MKIPFYLDDPDDKYKFNGVDKKFNQTFFLDTTFIEELPNIILDDIVFEDVNNTSNKYFYPIYISCDFFFKDITNFYFNIPSNVIKHIRNNRCKILVINPYEGYDLGDFENIIETKILNVYKIGYKDVVLVTGNLIKKSKKGLINVYYNFWEKIVKTYNDFILKDFADNVFSNNLREHKFICLQRRPKIQRLMLYTELYDYRKEGILTMGIGDNMETLDYIIELETQFYNKKSLKKYKKKKLRNTLPREYDAKLSYENPTADANVDKYLNSYLHVVSETYFENQNQQMFFSEKVYKPIIFMQPFILFSQTHSLKYLKDLGFKTFQSKFINEEYDNIEDDRERFMAALQQVKRVITLSKSELHFMMQEYADTLLHNYCHLKGRFNTQNNRLYLDLVKILRT